jgi:hypothetical protein
LPYFFSKEQCPCVFNVSSEKVPRAALSPLAWRRRQMREAALRRFGIEVT